MWKRKCAFRVSCARSASLAPWQPLDPSQPRERAELASSRPPLPWLRSAAGAGPGGKALREPAPPPTAAGTPPRAAGRTTWWRSCATPSQPVTAGARLPLPAPASATCSVVSPSFWRVRCVACVLGPQTPSPPGAITASARKPLAGWARRRRRGDLRTVYSFGDNTAFVCKAAAPPPEGRPPTANAAGSSPGRCSGCPAPRLQGEGGHAPRPHPGAPAAPRFQPWPPALAPRLLRRDATPCLRVQTPAADPDRRRKVAADAWPTASASPRIRSENEPTDWLGGRAAKGQEQESGVIC